MAGEGLERCTPEPGPPVSERGASEAEPGASVPERGVLGAERGPSAPEPGAPTSEPVVRGPEPGASVPEPVVRTPEPGAFAVDGRDGRVGRVMGRSGSDVRLRPPGGGPEWACPVDAVQSAPPGVVLRARVTEINREGQLPR